MASEIWEDQHGINIYERGQAQMCIGRENFRGAPPRGMSM